MISKIAELALEYKRVEYNLPYANLEREERICFELAEYVEHLLFIYSTLL